MSDAELLAQHRRGEGDDCFAELVRRNIGWVHGVARRRLRDAHLAEDVAQAVFILLHRKSPALADERSLVAWLHRTTWYASEVAARQRRRRQHHETEAAMRQASSERGNEAQQWDELAPLLDQMIDRLGREEREAVLLRFYRQMSFAEVATAMGSTEEAVRKRVSRALDKLRARAASKGLAITAAALAVGLDLPTTAPAGLIATTTGAALAHGASALPGQSALLAKGASIMMTITKLKAAAVVTLAVVLAGGAGVAVIAATSPSTTRRVTTSPAKKEYARLAPYAAIRFNGEKPEVRLKADDQEWLELFAIDDYHAETIVASAKKNFRDLWQKRVAEDLVEVMSKMGHEPGKTVKLRLGKVEGGMFEVQAEMTEANRHLIRDARQAETP